MLVQRKLAVKQLSYAATPGGGFSHAFVSRQLFRVLFIKGLVFLARLLELQLNDAGLLFLVLQLDVLGWLLDLQLDVLGLLAGLPHILSHEI